MKISNLLNKFYLDLCRRLIGEIGLGFLAAWWLLWLLELLRPGSVSLYLDLNLILVLALIAWLLGCPVKHFNRTAVAVYLALSVIIISVLLIKLVKSYVF